MPRHDTAGDDAETPPRGGEKTMLMAGLGALGVVFGDIGTSPLYAIRQSFFGPNSVPPSTVNVLGVLSLVFWALMIVISFKYLLFVMRQNNDGEGGIIALVALLRPWARRHRLVRAGLIPLGLFGAALLYGDGTITPAISVLSAIEGLSVINPSLQAWVVPATVVILFALFLVQRRGTQRIGHVFGPVMLVWFIALALLGLRGIVLEPGVFEAIHPGHAMEFFAHNGGAGFLVLGTVFLVVTGGEALYADLGHFGLGPIRLSWFALVLPALVLNYFGQGALLLAHPGEAMHPFFDLAPQVLRYPLVMLATVATIIASQAVISGTFSLTAQAIHLDLLPRMQVIHTSADERGQVYIPVVNWLLLLATAGVVIAFGSSGRLGSAYGLSVSADMAITTVLAALIAWRYGRMRWLVAILAPAVWMVDWAFFSANLFKFWDGGWYPLLVGVLVFTVMTTWRRGRELVTRRLDDGRQTITMEEFLNDEKKTSAHRIPGTAVFLTGRIDTPPPLLLHHLAHHHVLQRQLILLTVHTEAVPRVAAARRVTMDALSPDCIRIRLDYGYRQTPNVPAALRLCQRGGLDIDLDQTTYYLGRETLIPRADDAGMALWRERLFAFLERNALRAFAFFRIPPRQVIELGVQVEL